MKFNSRGQLGCQEIARGWTFVVEIEDARENKRMKR
jgi:hypothetical protein